MLVLAVVLAAILVLGILLAPLGAGIVVVGALVAVGIVGFAVWGLFFARWRRGGAGDEVGGGLESPELLGPGGPDDPDRVAPASDVEQQPVDAGTRR